MRFLSRKLGVALGIGFPLQSMQPSLKGFGVDILAVLKDLVREGGRRVDGVPTWFGFRFVIEFCCRGLG